MGVLAAAISSPDGATTTGWAHATGVELHVFNRPVK